MQKTEIPYWMALAHANGFSTRRKMEFLIEAVFNKSISLVDVLENIKQGQTGKFMFTEKELNGLVTSVDDLANYSFLAEELVNRGIHIISVFDNNYPKTLKQHLKKTSPVVLYARGNISLLKTNCIAIVGSRKSSAKSLAFTDKMAERAVSQNKTVVSGFAKGVDRQALDSALKYAGHSIIVLPQGINTYHSKTYYAHINRGEVLVVSTYHPKAPWSVGLAMDRNNTIYGMADEIYVAESDVKGGTWTGVINGLKKGWKVFVRMPEPDEQNANLKLIERGAIAVGLDAESIQQEKTRTIVTEQNLFTDYTDPTKEVIALSKEELVDRVFEALKYKKSGLTIDDIIKQFRVDVSKKTVSGWLKYSDKLDFENRGGKLYFNLPGRTTTDPELFQ